MSRLTNNLKAERAMRRMTQTDLAKRLGVRTATICNIETGQVDPKVTTVLKICKLYGREVEEVFNLKETK